MKIKIEPRKTTDQGGYLCMPLKQNVPNGHKEWKLTKCPECGRDCWNIPLPKEFKGKFNGKLCTECALRRGVKCD